MWNINNINEQNRNRFIETENRLMVARGEGSWGPRLKKVKRLGSTSCLLQNSYRDIINNNIVTMYDAR